MKTTTTGGITSGADYGGGTVGGEGHLGTSVHGGKQVKDIDWGKMDEQNKHNQVLRRLAEDKRQEKIERFRNRQLGSFENKKTRDFFLNKVLQAGKWDGSNVDKFYGQPWEDQEASYKNYLAQREAGIIDAYGNRIGGTGGGDGSYYPRDIHRGTGVNEVSEVIEEKETPSAFQQSLTGTVDTPNYYVGEGPLASNLEWGQAYGVDPRTMGRTTWANGGRIGRAFGGIMDSSTGRRAYGLGSIFKSIGKAAKKVFKSPVGKAALIGLGGYWLGGGQALGGAKMFGTKFGQNFAFDNLMKRKGMSLLTKKGLGESWDPWKVGIAGLSALPFFMGQPEDDEGDKGADYDLLKDQYAKELMRIKAGAMAGSLDPNEFNYLGVKDGGRIGYYAGGQSIPSDYTMEDAMMTTTQDKLGGITDVMKQADLNRQGSVGQFYAAQGGRIGYAEGDTAEVLGPVTPGKGITDIDTGDFNLSDSGEYTQMYPSNPKETRAKIWEIYKKLMKLNPLWPSDKAIELATKLVKKGMEGLSQDDTGGWERVDPERPAPDWDRQPWPKLPRPERRWPTLPESERDEGDWWGSPGDVMPPRDFPPDEGIIAPPRNFPPDEGIIVPPRRLTPKMEKRYRELLENRPMAAQGGRIGAQEGGLMDLGGMEKDYRQEGGFVPIGGKEKADDVPARLSKNEFVFTADAVRGAGGGDIDAGAEVMENVMKNLEQGGQVSEETQGLTGAQEMFGVSERLSEVV
jgi:hypothetical protein